MNEEGKKPKYMYEGSDWDKLSPFHFLHRKITGIPLTDFMLKFYIFIFLLSLFLAVFTK